MSSKYYSPSGMWGHRMDKVVTPELYDRLVSLCHGARSGEIDWELPEFRHYTPEERLRSEDDPEEFCKRHYQNQLTAEIPWWDASRYYLGLIPEDAECENPGLIVGYGMYQFPEISIRDMNPDFVKGAFYHLWNG